MLNQYSGPLSQPVTVTSSLDLTNSGEFEVIVYVKSYKAMARNNHLIKIKVMFE